MKRVISTLRFVLLFSNVILLALASAEMPERLKLAMISHRQQYRVARRLAGTPLKSQSRPVKRLAPDDSNTYNWAGATQSNIPGGSGTFNAVTAEWLIPDVTVPPNGVAAFLWGVSAFVGIDGSAECPLFFQAGTKSFAFFDDEGNIETYVQVFAEWYPAKAVELSLAVRIQDTVQVNIKAISSSRGTVEVINLTSGESTQASLTAPSPDYNLCGLTADWMIGSLQYNMQVPLAKFSPFNLVNCAAGTTESLSTDLTSSTLLTLVDDNLNIIATPTLVSNTALTVTYG